MRPPNNFSAAAASRASRPTSRLLGGLLRLAQRSMISATLAGLIPRRVVFTSRLLAEAMRSAYGDRSSGYSPLLRCAEAARTLSHSGVSTAPGSKRVILGPSGGNSLRNELSNPTRACLLATYGPRRGTPTLELIEPTTMMRGSLAHRIIGKAT